MTIPPESIKIGCNLDWEGIRDWSLITGMGRGMGELQNGRSFSHAGGGGGGREKIYPLFGGGGRNKFRTCDFPIL